jgi:hypothetical protein
MIFEDVVIIILVGKRNLRQCAKSLIVMDM